MHNRKYIVQVAFDILGKYPLGAGKVEWTGIDSLALLLFVCHQLLPALALLMALSGADDLFVDMVYVYRRIWRYVRFYRHTPRMTAQALGLVPIKPIAVMIPAWDESSVIGAMLRSTTRLWPQPELHFFVGCYPNDADTLAIVADLAARDARIHQVVVSRHGPTTKAHCLNQILNNILAWEQDAAVCFTAFLGNYIHS